MTKNTTGCTVIAAGLAAGLAPAVAARFPRRRGPSVVQRQDEIHVDGREDQEADLVIEDDGRVAVRAVVRLVLPAGADAGEVFDALRRLGVL
jgi:hypothetical protein